MLPLINHSALERISQQDLAIFSSRFREAVAQHVTLFKDLFFIKKNDDLSVFSLPAAVRKTVETFFEKPARQERLLISDKQTICFSLLPAHKDIVIVLTGVDDYFNGRVSRDWLENFCQQVENSFLLIKRASTDLETGLPNIQCFLDNLQEAVLGESPSLLLIEVYPRARSAYEAQVHKMKISRSLNACLNGRMNLYYLGNHVFGLLPTSREIDDLHIIGRRLLAWLRRDGFRRVHLGLCQQDGFVERGESQRESQKSFFENANFALHVARKRGPFALCDYHQFNEPDEHPLRKPSQSLLAKFKRKWRDVDMFSVAELQPSDQHKINKLIGCFPEKQCVAAEKQKIYLFFAYTSAEEAQKIISSWLVQEKLDGIITGIAYYPHFSFSKNETIINSRKASLHAAFYGPDGMAIFDEVSLNVSGDIYYAEGDLTRAVGEYKKGIACAPGDVNLLNSLGVAYADMARHKDAQRCFTDVLSIESDNFMALYNAGLEADLLGNSEAALDYFLRARANGESDVDIDADLTYRCGRLLCLERRYQEALDLLLPWYEKNVAGRIKERALPFLGQAYYGMQDYAKAAEWLQRALQHNEFDAESMGRLGVCYLVLKEGSNIALSLCSKSIELEPDNKMLRLCLARVQIACKLHNEARTNIGRCLRSKQTRSEAQLLSALNYLEQGMSNRAKSWLAKLPQDYPVEPDIDARMKKLAACCP